MMPPVMEYHFDFAIFCAFESEVAVLHLKEFFEKNLRDDQGRTPRIWILCDNLDGMERSNIDNIRYALEHSRYYFYYVDRKFLEEKWCKFQKEEGLEEHFKEGNQSIIVPVITEKGLPKPHGTGTNRPIELWRITKGKNMELFMEELNRGVKICPEGMNYLKFLKSWFVERVLPKRLSNEGFVHEATVNRSNGKSAYGGSHQSAFRLTFPPLSGANVVLDGPEPCSPKLGGPPVPARGTVLHLPDAKTPNGNGMIGATYGSSTPVNSAAGTGHGVSATPSRSIKCTTGRDSSFHSAAEVAIASGSLPSKNVSCTSKNKPCEPTENIPSIAQRVVIGQESDEDNNVQPTSRITRSTSREVVLRAQVSTVNDVKKENDDLTNGNIQNVTNTGLQSNGEFSEGRSETSSNGLVNCNNDAQCDVSQCDNNGDFPLDETEIPFSLEELEALNEIERRDMDRPSREVVLRAQVSTVNDVKKENDNLTNGNILNVTNTGLQSNGEFSEGRSETSSNGLVNCNNDAQCDVSQCDNNGDFPLDETEIPFNLEEFEAFIESEWRDMDRPRRIQEMVIGPRR